ncbi:MAG: aspartate kinase [Candidatus Raymondbacteria bacterium RifOxyA12_full_50_37]|uniref:Aspartokinase n=1 Tax=Candidatus Raymondbacteria bacterium RIFOXYD12_FULL_49_13 TaxID=1817890 RepID=A0A1F7FBH1_UNCRA|nr:MAG: aspartate kinase [Candidatus Raymondbacteria bacterium RifOxyA12_full_50_37]OGJ92548.1 MAG: aspartate kinase [Candidatus Raymondbacteria bacterium RIFOXYA2_FULL_49_16]OGJ97902.1 MAG: aspartate kinase [Candidatus Raymondbacteria bacterium RIFOXYC2_FULL_50_21]OGK03983.1 MAG: aspartate kinase [Candidatus Raymondbacteria bacterium RIFOXYD12_FULL_49_13]OGP44787.1 MAG: aspartate kinase [Candidatus Raymondbacteria bacterium RIFOXYB2_FULL_49_35]
MKIITQKYGGSSVATTEKIRRIAEKVKKRVDGGYKLIVVLSAMGKTTDNLIALSEEITLKPSAREMDMLLSTGEQVTIALFSMALHELNVGAISLTGHQAGIVTDTVHRKAKIVSIDNNRIMKEFETNDVVVVAGFQGIDQEHNISTLGRGGSDLSAVAIAAALRTECCEIYTDVDGVFTADPRIVPAAKHIPEISFDEMLELASSGAKVMQARSIECGKKYNMPIWVKNTFNDTTGTLIKEEDETMEKVMIRGVALEKKEAKVTLKSVPDKPGIAAEVFSRLGAGNINVDMIVQNSSTDGTTDISFTAPKEDLPVMMETANKIAKEIGAPKVDVNPSIAKVSIVGIGMRSHAGVAAKMFRVLADNNVNIDMISTSEIKISVVVPEKDGEKAMQSLHAAFELDK